MTDFRKNEYTSTFMDSKSIDEFRNTINQLFSAVSTVVKEIKPLSEIKDSFRALILSLPNYSENVESLKTIAKTIGEIVSKELDNLNSELSYYGYFKILSDYFWVFPYKITPAQIKELTKEGKSEKEFDRFMLEHFSKDVLNDLFLEITNHLPANQKTLFKQCVDSFYRNEYTLCSLGLYSIIDDLLSFYLFNKGCVARGGIFKPIIRELDEKELFGKNLTLDFVLLMMDKNINSLFGPIDFNKKIYISKNKDTNRNTSVHGKYYSNKKESDLMLLNSLYWLLVLQDYLKDYKDKLCFKRKKFYLISEESK